MVWLTLKPSKVGGVYRIQKKKEEKLQKELFKEKWGVEDWTKN